MASVANKPWDGSAARFTDQQWARSCVLDRGSSVKGKARYSLPIREPDGAINANGVAAAAGRLAGTKAQPDAKTAARHRLVAAYRQIGKPPPDDLSVTAAAPAGLTASDHEFVSDMLHAHHRLLDRAHAHVARGGHSAVARFAANVLGTSQQNITAAAGLMPDGKGTPQGPSDYAY